ncbi:hypothetical protein ACHAP5_004482 [Fusarium lateritium]
MSNGPTFNKPIQASNILTGFSATGNAQQCFNFNTRAESRPLHSIPFERNEDFIPRLKLTSQLEEVLPMDSDEYRSAAVWGLGGSGKTQIALEYAYNRYHTSPCAVFWVHADNESSFTHDYALIAKVLGVSHQESKHEFLHSVRQKIELLDNWLLVLDNADDLSLFGVGTAAGKRTGKYLDYVPKGPVGTVLWTSRDEGIVGSLVGLRRCIHVPSMTLEESRALLQSTRVLPASEKELAKIDSLIEELQYLPLAISQAGTYMRRTETTIIQYLEGLREEKSRWRILKETEFDRHRARGSSNSILETWRTSIRRIRQENEMAYKTLLILAFSDSEDIPQQLVEDAAAHGQTEPADEILERKKRRAVRRLENFSFLTERRGDCDERRFEMNKLVRDAVRYGVCVGNIERDTDVRSRRLRRKRITQKGMPKSKENVSQSALEAIQ